MIRPGIREYFRLRSRRERLSADVAYEIEFHIEQRVQYLVARGWSDDDARGEARRRFGELAHAKLTLQRSATRREYRMSIREWVAAWRDDFRYAARGFAREPFLAAVIVLTLALGIGANATMFGIIDELLLRGPAHIAKPNSLARIYFTRETKRSGKQTTSFAGYVHYTMMKQDTRDFDGVAAYSIQEQTLVGEGAFAKTRTVTYASSDFFPLLGVQPALGRFYSQSEDQPLAPERVAVIDWGLWQQEYGGARDVIGRPIVVANHTYTIIGVAPRGFTGVEHTGVDVWAPLSSQDPPTKDWPTSWNAEWLQIVARLKTNVTPGVAAANTTTIFRAASHEAAPKREHESLSLLPLRFDDSGREAREMRIARWLVGVSVIVLLIACANVANLLLARSVRRRREVGVRLALGISRTRLARLLLSEALVLAVAGTAGALAIAGWGGRLVRAALLPDVTWGRSPVSGSVLLWAAITMVMTGLLTGLAPAIAAVRHDLAGTLRGGAREGGVTRSHTRSALTVLQAAFSVLLLIGAGLFVHSLWNISHLHLGIEPDKVLAAGVTWTPITDTATAARAAEKQRRNDALLQAARAIAHRNDVESASISVGTPFLTAFQVDLKIPGIDSIPEMPGRGPYVSAVASGYFKTVGTRLLHGRDFTEADRRGSEPVAIVNLTMARTLWHTDTPFNQCLIVGKSTSCARIVGVVEDARRDRFREEPAFQYYIPFGQETGFGGAFVNVRPKRGMEAALRRDLPDVLRQYASGMTYANIVSLQQLLSIQVRPWRMAATMFCLFGALALLIAAVGLFSVIGYNVTQRRAELGIRLALGARPAAVVRIVVQQGIALAISGIAIGTVLALGTGRFLQPLLFETSAHDVFTFGSVACVLLIAAIAACAVPALRASKVNPVEALRTE